MTLDPGLTDGRPSRRLAITGLPSGHRVLHLAAPHSFFQSLPLSLLVWGSIGVVVWLAAPCGPTAAGQLRGTADLPLLSLGLARLGDRAGVSPSNPPPLWLPFLFSFRDRGFGPFNFFFPFSFVVDNYRVTSIINTSLSTCHVHN